MSIAIDYKKEIISLMKELPKDKLQELIDFAQFLKFKAIGFSYTQVEDSANYLKDLRLKEGKKLKSGKIFIRELIEWQKSKS